ncbi:MAG: alpha-glucosidase [Vicinamibacteria bacterium]
MTTRSLLLAAGCGVAITLAGSALAQGDVSPADPHEWWKHAVFYELYPRSFADSNGDGVGDLNGITSRLDYLKDLGVDAIWIAPCFPSPQVDFGYDVSDYEQIDPMYGTLADFDRLSAEAKRRGIRIVLDFVVNHTSDRHAWFVDSRSSRTSAHRDWFIWRDGQGAGKPPNNWLSTFGGSAWELDPTTGQYYYHYFYVQQPDLNWRNPAVEKAMLDATRFWYKRGVSGFRLDAVDTLFEDPQLKDDPGLPGTDKFGRPRLNEIHNTKLPEVHDALKKLRKAADEYGAVLVGETWTNDIAELKKYYGNGDEVQLPMDFMFTMVNKLSPGEFRKQIAAVDGAGGWPVYVLSNHDIARSFNRYGDGAHDDAIVKVMAALYLTLRGTPILYYGEELGMETNDPRSRDDVRDPIGRLGWPVEKGRDGERTPMQWDATSNAGFTTGQPWLPVAPSYPRKNVAAESKDPASILSFYKGLTALRRSHPALREGDYVPLAEKDERVLAYLRRTKDATVLVALNMSAEPQTLRPEVAAHGSKAVSAKALLGTTRVAGSALALDAITLQPFEVVVAELSR